MLSLLAEQVALPARGALRHDGRVIVSGGAELVLATSVSIRRVGRTTVPAVYVATRLISRLRQHWVCLDKVGDDQVALSVWLDKAPDSRFIDDIQAEIKAHFLAESHTGWELEFVRPVSEA